MSNQTWNTNHLSTDDPAGYQRQVEAEGFEEQDHWEEDHWEEEEKNRVWEEIEEERNQVEVCQVPILLNNLSR